MTRHPHKPRSREIRAGKLQREAQRVRLLSPEPDDLPVYAGAWMAREAAAPVQQEQAHG